MVKRLGDLVKQRGRGRREIESEKGGFEKIGEGRNHHRHSPFRGLFMDKKPGEGER